MELLTHVLPALGISQEDLDEAQNRAEQSGSSVLDTLLEMNLITHTEYTQAVAHAEGMRHVTLTGSPISPDDLIVLPEPFARLHRVVCYESDGERVQIAAESISSDLQDLLHQRLEVPFDIALTDTDSLSYALGIYQRYLREHYGDRIARHASKLIPLEAYIHPETSLPSRYISELQDSFDAHTISDLLLHVASNMRAHDLYIDKNVSSTDVSMRFGGGSYPTMKLDAHIFDRLLWVYFKKADISLSSLRAPLHTTTLPTELEGVTATITFVTTGSEVSHIHISLQDTNRLFPTIESLLPSAQQAHMLHTLSSSHDIVLLGKDTMETKRSYYALLEEMHRRERRVVSLEDTVEVNIPGVTQLALSKKDSISALLSSNPIVQSEALGLYRQTKDIETYRRLFLRTHGTVLARFEHLNAYINLRAAIGDTRPVVLFTLHEFSTAHDAPMRTLSDKERRFLKQTLKDTDTTVDLSGTFATAADTKRSRKAGAVSIFGVSMLEEIASGSLFEKTQRRSKASVTEHALMRSSQGDITVEDIIKYVTG